MRKVQKGPVFYRMKIKSQDKNGEKTMKKLMILCLTLAMCATMMTACSQNGGSSEGGNSTQQEQ